MLLHKTRALAYLRHAGLDALIATSPVNITYFADYACWLDPIFKEYMARPGASSHLAQNYALFPLEGEPALVVNPFMGMVWGWICAITRSWPRPIACASVMSVATNPPTCPLNLIWC